MKRLFILPGSGKLPLRAQAIIGDNLLGRTESPQDIRVGHANGLARSRHGQPSRNHGSQSGWPERTGLFSPSNPELLAKRSLCDPQGFGNAWPPLKSPSSSTRFQAPPTPKTNTTIKVRIKENDFCFSFWPLQLGLSYLSKNPQTRGPTLGVAFHFGLGRENSLGLKKLGVCLPFLLIPRVSPVLGSPRHFPHETLDDPVLQRMKRYDGQGSANLERPEGFRQSHGK